jgi:hypothetical protein
MDHATQSADGPSLNRLAFSATTHCLTGCSIGEVLGMVIGTALGWGNWPTVVLCHNLLAGRGAEVLVGAKGDD